MENGIKIFENEEFGSVRTFVDENGEVLFCGKDVAEALGYVNTRKAIISHCRGVTKRYAPTESGEQEMAFITEGDVYRLIVRSKLPSAEKFERWLFDEVLPSIRKTGMYVTNNLLDEIRNNPEALYVALGENLRLRKEVENKNNLIMLKEAELEEAKPKLTYYDMVLNSPELLTVTQIAQDYGISAQQLNNLLKAYKVQYKLNKNTWILYAEYKDCGYVQSCTYEIDGKGKTNTLTKWTQKGRLFIYELLKKHNIMPVIESKAS